MAARQQRQTLLAVGEGHSEAAFLKHLRSLYCASGVGLSVTVKNAYGKGPDNVIEHSLRLAATAAYDHRLCLLDTDIEWPAAMRNKAKRKKIFLIGSEPCLEGLLLDILGQSKHGTSTDCKRSLRSITKSEMTEPTDYKTLFIKQTLDQARKRISALDELIKMFEGW